MSRALRATLIGTIAVLMWSTLAPLTALSGAVPPFQLVAMAFVLAFLVGMAVRRTLGAPHAARAGYPLAAWGIGVGGLFGFHFLYFMALRNAPAAEANLINYLWPLLIVLFSALLPGHHLRWWHVAGALAGLAGAALLITGGSSLAIQPEHTIGYLYALASGLTWAAYSVLNRRFAHVETGAVAAFCGVTAARSALCHIVLEETVWPRGGAWLAVLGLGLGPVGGAFYAWDYAVKHGDLRVLGAAAYAAPLLSTTLLVAFGMAEATWALAAACVLIVGGAALAARDLRRTRPPASRP